MNLRSHARLAILSHAANEAFRSGRFDPAGPNRAPLDRRTSVLFSTAFVGAAQMRVWLSDWYRDEARIVAALWPTENVDEWIAASGANEMAGDVVASGYLMRGSHLRLSDPLDPAIFIRRARLDAMMGLLMPSEEADALRLYPRYLHYAAAA